MGTFAVDYYIAITFIAIASINIINAENLLNNFLSTFKILLNRFKFIYNFHLKTTTMTIKFYISYNRYILVFVVVENNR